MCLSRRGVSTDMLVLYFADVVVVLYPVVHPVNVHVEMTCAIVCMVRCEHGSELIRRTVERVLYDHDIPSPDS